MGLVNLMFEVTQSCNCDCFFCYNVWKGDPAYPKGELSLDKIKKLFDRLYKGLPVDSIYLSGGEPLLRQDLEDIIAYFKSKGLFIGISTNGLSLTPQRASSLIKAGAGLFEITLLGAGSKLHDGLTGCPGSFEKACSAINSIVEHQSNLQVAFTATAENIHSIADVIELGYKLGARTFSFYRFVPTGKGTKRQALIPTKKQLNAAIGVMDQKAGQLKLKINLGIPVEPCLFDKKPVNIKFTSCHAGSGKLAIDPLGNLRLCEQDSRILGDLFRKNFAMLVLKERLFGKKQVLKETCAKCCERPLCRGGCRLLGNTKSSLEN